MEVKEFLHTMRGKKFSKNIFSFLGGEDLDDIEIGKMLSSYLTHAFIEAQISEDALSVFLDLKIKEVLDIMHEFIGGLCDVSALRERLRSII